MNTARLLAGVAGLVAVALVVSTQVVSQEKAPQPPGEPPWAQAMAKWQELNAKGPEHQKFVEMVGTWETESKMWMAPGAEPMLSKGTAEIRLLFDGRYVEQRYKCDMGDRPFEGLSIEGYDRFKKKYVSIWIDNMGTGIFVSEGTADASGKVCTYFGKAHDPMTGEPDKVVRSVAREISPDKVVYEMYDRPAGQDEFKTMEIVYTRKK
jgi:hypothetical protein